MAGLPPPPIRAGAGDYVWLDWYNSLQRQLTTTGAITWAQVDKAGSSISDLQNKSHDLTTGLQGGTTGQHYHLTAVECGLLTPAYGAFYNTATQTAAAINTAYTITFPSTEYSNGVVLGSPTSRLVCPLAGTYNFQIMIETNKSSASPANVWVWARVNGTDIPNSANHATVGGSGADTILSWNFLQTMAANDYFELVWMVDSTAVQIVTTNPPSGPVAPPASITVNRIAL